MTIRMKGKITIKMKGKIMNKLGRTIITILEGWMIREDLIASHEKDNCYLVLGFYILNV
jgi:hypothetical protein